MRLLLVWTLAFVIGCDGSDPDPDPAPPPEAQPIGQLDFQVGTAYTYRVTSILADSAGTVLQEDVDEVQVRIDAEDESLAGMQNLTRFALSSAQWPGQVGYTWYRNTETGLEDVAYQNTSAFPAGVPKAAPHPVAWPFFAPAVADTALVIRDVTRVVLLYPLETGATWAVFSEGLVQQTRTVTGTESVEVEAGTFSCAVIETRFASPPIDTVFIDYIAEEGLILRMVQSTSPAVGPNGVPTGEVTVFTQRFELTNHTP